MRVIQAAVVCFKFSEAEFGRELQKNQMTCRMKPRAELTHQVHLN